MQSLIYREWQDSRNSRLSDGKVARRSTAHIRIDRHQRSGEGECGSCAILMNGELVNSCLIPALQAADANLTTIEGLAVGPQLSALQQAFLDCGGAQCGICTPGMILASQQLLSKTSSPGMDDIREALAGNLCRCTGYIQIFEAVAQAARLKVDV